ncbi:VWA domain-containing protein (plasmid) [Tistrella bauzanensis]|uniref:VWA domain-containing protein n=1 Tax=Tistrella arctica TaxID=3133430 RepID=A0ABU9YP11_9PROT
MTTVSAVPIVDDSISMTSNKLSAQTRINTRYFLQMMRAGDRVGVVAYSREAWNLYAPQGALATVDQNKTVTRKASESLGTLKFDGPSTAIGLGLQQGRSLLDSAPDPKACVLLSDGEQNYGPNPTDVLPSYRVMTCAMGASSDEGLLQEIATKTGGQYFLALHGSDMGKVYTQIRGATSSASVLANDLETIDSDDFRLVSVMISQTDGANQLAAVWNDESIAYTRSTPYGKQIAITLVDPNGNVSDIEPDVVGDGYVIFDPGSLAAGEWNIQFEYAGNGVDVDSLGAALLYPGQSQRSLAAASPIDVVFRIPRMIKAGEPMTFEVDVVEGGQPVRGALVRAAVSRPTTTIDEALERYDDQLGAVALPKGVAPGRRGERVLRLSALRQKLLPEIDILAYRRSLVSLAEHPLGYVGRLTETRRPGTYNVEFTVTGESPVAGLFQRTWLASVVVNG